MFFASEVSGGSTNLLVFEISHVEYCLSNRIQYSIVKPDNIFQLGAIKRSKYSLLRIDDKSIPLIDLKKFLTDEKQRINNNSRIIIIEHQDLQFGFLVERINEIIALYSRFVTTSLKFIPKLNDGYLEGIIEFEDRKLKLLNIEKIVTDIGCI